MDKRDNNAPDFLINAKTIKLTIYVGLVIGNVLFAVLYPEAKIIGILGALFFVIAFVITNRSTPRHGHRKIADTSKKTIPIERK